MLLFNLLEETIESIEDSGHTVDDIIFIGSEKSGHSCSWDQFKVLADKEYGEGYGTPLVVKDLIIVFSDGQKMWRYIDEEDEGWEYSTPFQKPHQEFQIENLFVGDHPTMYTLEEVNPKTPANGK